MDNRLLKIWNVLIIFMQVFTSVMYMYFSAFRFRRGKKPFHTQNVITVVVECIFLLEMIANFFKEY
jgi:hypothetical protein